MLGRLRDHVEKLYPFSVVARLGSITRAAEKLAISQAALSHSIKVLEDTVETALLVRKAKGVQLTPAGEALCEFAKRLFLELESVELKLRNPACADAGKLRIATHETLAIHVWPEFLSAFAVRHPHLHLSLVSGRVDELVRGILNRDLHLIVSVEPKAQHGLVVEPLYTNQLAFFAAPVAFAHRYPALNNDELTREEAAAIPVLTDLNAHVEQHLPIPQFLLQHGLASDLPFELTSFEAATRLATLGQGLAFLPQRNAAVAVAAGLLREVPIRGLTGPSFARYRLCATYHEKDVGNPALATLLRELRSAPAFKPVAH